MVYAVIMAGGSGTRFWPESRKKKPKQLLSIAGEETMIRATVERIRPAIPFERIMVITGGLHAREIREQLPELPDNMVVTEPFGRNTAACIALAAFKLQRMDPDAVMAVLPADHLIGKEQEFRTAIQTAVQTVSQRECLLTFGIVPNRPETGYGYIKLGDDQLTVNSTKVHSVERFVEKPDLETANGYVASGEYMWNSGMFLWKVDHIIQAFDRHLPEMSRAMRSLQDAFGTPNESERIRETYEQIEPVSIDYAIMEKASNVLCLPIDVDWNDVGSWVSLEEVWESDKAGNAGLGDVVVLDSANCIVSSTRKLTALVGVEDLIVVDTPDALLICKKDRAQDVKKLQEILKERGLEHLL